MGDRMMTKPYTGTGGTMAPRGLLTTVGVTALGLGVLIGGSTGTPFAFAQESTPSAQTPAQTQAQQTNDWEAQKAQDYDDFISSLATELGDDKAAVDTAIRTALKQQVDAKQAAGELSVEQSAAIKAVIDVSQAPLFAGLAGHGEMHGFDGHGGFEGRGPRGDDDHGGKMPGGMRPPAQPGDEQGEDQGADQATDQSAPLPAAPSVDVTIL
jgi:hypothetical protein